MRPRVLVLASSLVLIVVAALVTSLTALVRQDPADAATSVRDPGLRVTAATSSVVPISRTTSRVSVFTCVTYSTGVPTTRLALGNFRADALIAGGASIKVVPTAVTASRIPGCYQLAIEPAAGRAWNGKPFALALQVARLTDQGSTIVSNIPGPLP